MKSKSKSASAGQKARKVVPEKKIQADILKYLESTGLLFWRQNSGLIPVPTGRFGPNGKPIMRMVKLGTQGLPDIIAVLPPSGRLLGLEVKSAVGKLREAQIHFAQKLISSGGEYCVVRSVEDTINAIENAKKTLPKDILW